jgi:uncharacterized protein YbbK (DUF523 family)
MTNEADPREIVIVSACLIGMNTRFDGGDAKDEQVFSGGNILIPLCPEELGGLPTPRPPAEITGGSGNDVLDGARKIIDSNAIDVTTNFIKGAEIVLKIAKLLGAKRAILKEGSPSCGVNRIKRAGADKEGMGVTTALLTKNGITIKGL